MDPELEYEWDEAKAEANVAKHGVRFEDVSDFEWEEALTLPDDRADYGEQRWKALGKIQRRVHVLCFTLRADRIRVISLRKANPREVEAYERAQE